MRGWATRALLAISAYVLIGWVSVPQASGAPPTDPSRCDVGVLNGLSSREFVVIERSATGPKPVTKPQLVIESATLETSPRPHCWVMGHIHTQNAHVATEDPAIPVHGKEIQFDVALPTAWSERFLMIGCGALCGQDTPDPRQVNLASVLDRGYAMANTDTGHTGGSLFGGWARNLDGTQNVDRIVNYGHRAVHLATVAAKPLIAHYYRSPVRLSYFHGGSNGGRQALIEAQRYPADFDGIVADRPAVYLPGFIGAFAAHAKAEFPVDRFHPVVPPSLMGLVGSATMQRCDPIDGLRDGIISAPASCGFDPRRHLPACPGDVPASSCLTRAQINVVNTVYEPETTRLLGQIYPGFVPGYEDAGGSWDTWVVGAPPPSRDVYPTLGYASAEQVLKYLVFNDPDYQVQSFDVRNQGHFLFMTPHGVPLAQIMHAENPDLTAFKARGGKLIVTHGWADIVTNPIATRRYYESVVSRMGGLSRTRDFMRLFLSPGGLHGTPANAGQPFVSPTAGLGPALDALEAWRERGVAPDSLLASNSGGGPAGITRPVCAYPLVATYRGRGDIYAASSFACR